MKIQIEWKSSHYHSDGRRRSHPKASTVHGWLVKWRATFSGNERLRKEGIREMREARAARERKSQKKAARLAKAGASESSHSLWPSSLDKKERQSPARKRPSQSSSSKHPRNRRPSQHPTTASHNHTPTPQTRKPSHNSHKGTKR